MSIIPDTIIPEGASDEVVAALNGKSSGSTAVWDHQPGDYLRAAVRARGTFKHRLTQQPTGRLVLCVEEGTEYGQSLAHHAHRVLPCQHAELRNLVDDLDPKPGDVLTIVYLGRDDRPGHKSRHLFRYSVERHGSDAGAADDDEF